MGAVGLGIRTALAMQEGDALNAFALTGLALAALLRRARLLVPVRLRRGIVTPPTAGAARGVLGPVPLHVPWFHGLSTHVPGIRGPWIRVLGNLPWNLGSERRGRAGRT